MQLMTRFSFPAALGLTAILLSSCVNEPETRRRPEPGGRDGGFREQRTIVEERDSDDDDEPIRKRPDTTVTETTTETTEPVAPPAPVVGNYEYGKQVPGKPGFVTSPHAASSGYVDVRGFPPGTEVKCPYTQKIFLVP